ncbi:hypothetical protein EOL99_03255 [Candidatus Falkowbacteria bacterium]|nr:hypothetical protein [Candidatus Falkowbacteria bacterium]
MTYKETTDKHQKEHDKFVKEAMFFAFSDKQFEEGLLKFPKDSKFYSVGAGAFILQDRFKEYKSLLARQKEELKEVRKDLNEFRKEASYQLANHEAGYTGRYNDAFPEFDELNQEQQKIILQELKKQVRSSC